jgi:hypothetical protein
MIGFFCASSVYVVVRHGQRSGVRKGLIGRGATGDSALKVRALRRVASISLVSHRSFHLTKIWANNNDSAENRSAIHICICLAVTVERSVQVIDYTYISNSPSKDAWKEEETVLERGLHVEKSVQEAMFSVCGISPIPRLTLTS